MQITELLKLTKWFETNISKKEIPQKYSALHAKMNQNIRRNVNQRTNQNLVPFENEKKDLVSAINKINFHSLSLEQIKFLEKLHITDLLGTVGVNQIEDILTNNVLDIATATSKVQELSNRISTAQKTINELSSTLGNSFEIEENDEVEDGNTLMRIYFQNDVSINNLTNFKKLSANWYDIGRGIAMAQGKSPEDFKIIGAQKGSIVFDMVVAVGIAKSVSTILLEVFKVADRFLELVKKSEEIKNLKLNNKKIDQEIKKEAEKEKEEGIKTILNISIKELNINEKVEGDKVTALETSIKKLIDFTQNGGLVDFVQPNEKNETENNRDEIKKLKENISEIRKLESKIKLLENKLNGEGTKPNTKKK